MPQFDPDKVLRLISELRKAVDRLRTLSRLEREEFLKDPDRVGSSKYHFIMAVECCIDLCNHVIARNGYRMPEDYADTFKAMAEAGALGESFAADLANMARFRNRLVHLYWEVDDGQVHGILQTRLQDFKTFLDAMARFLDLANLKP